MSSIRSAFRLTILSLASYVFASDDPSLMARLLPLHVAHYEQLTGVQRRSIDRLSDMEPQSSAPLYWGLARHRDMMTLANMTLHALPDLPIVLLERFDHLTEHVDCNGDDGEMSLTFKSKPDFERAANAWRYINEHEDHRFLAIANHDGCAPEDERQPYIITNVREDPKMLTTYLTSHPIPLHEVAHTFDLDWGHFRPHELRRQRRDQQSDFMNRIKNGVNDFLWNTYIDVPHGRICKGNDPTCLPDRFFDYSNRDNPTQFNLHAGKDFTFARNLMNTLQFKCKDCWARGQVIATGNARVQNGKTTACTLTGKFNVDANIPIAVEKKGQNRVEKLGFSIPVVDVGIPFASVQIPGVFKVGGSVKLLLNGNLDVHGEGAVGATFVGSLPEHTVTLDLIASNDVNEGEDLTFTPPTWEFRNMKGSFGISGNFQLKVEFGIELGPDGSFGEATASITVPLPNWAYTFTTLAYSGGACKDDPTLSGLGVKTEGKYDVKIAINLNFKPPGDDKPATPVATQDVAKPLSKVLDGHCQGVDAPVPAELSPGQASPAGQEPEKTPGSDQKSEKTDGTNPDPGNSQSNSGTGESVANANSDSTVIDPSKPYSISDDVLGLNSNPDPGNYNFAENQNNQGVQLAANLGASPDVASGKVAPPAYGLSNDNLGIASNALQPSDPQKSQLANALIDPQTPSSGSNVASSSGSPFELGSLPSNTGGASSNPNYLAFIPGQNANQYTASLQGGGNSNAVASGGSSNTGQASANANAGTDTLFGTDNKFGAYTPSNALLSTRSPTNPPGGIDNNAQTAQLSTGNNNNALLSSTLGVDSNLFPAVTKRTLMGRAANRVRSFW